MKTSPRHLIIPAVGLAVALLGSGVPGGGPAAAASWWKPKQGTSWQWQLSGSIDTSVKAKVFDVDGADTSAAVVKKLHAKGARVVCYFSAGSWEDWRRDASGFPAAVKGQALDGWPGEKWLDIRRTDILLPIMEKRIKACRAKGFDAVEPDNVDGYTNSTGFPLTGADQRSYNRAIAKLAHKHGMGVALKNDPDQVASLVRYFDFAVVEECEKYSECGAWKPFISARKAVLHAEYAGSLSAICHARPRGEPDRAVEDPAQALLVAGVLLELVA